ncbi:MAG: hypothetical protein JRE27_05915 [Deltaproteobacteria bacterium]|nr:hypothetical protein [Deltaproteobacteria bacterium]
MLIKIKRRRIIPLLCLFFLACGYRFPGGGNLPNGVEKVFIEIFENRTNETGLENIITGDLIYEFIRNKKETNRDEADAILSGVCESMRIETIARKDVLTAEERRVIIIVDLQLTGSDGRVIWSEKDMRGNEAYDVSANKQETEINRRFAITLISKRLAERVYSRLTDDF